MERRRRTQFGGGVLLILLGAILLAFQFVPALRAWADTYDWSFSWPLIIVGVGLLFLVLGVIGGEPGMAVPACIVGGIGGLLFWQNTTGDWESWAYAWTLIPGFVGAGILLSGLLGAGLRQSLTSGSWLIIISLILFLVFSSFLGGPEILGDYWPALIIALGVLLLGRTLIRPR